MEFIYSYIRTICVFTLTITLILNIFPDRQYKKYIKLFAGILLLALVLNPIINIKKNKVDIEDIVNQNIDKAYNIDLEKELSVLETKIYERMSDGYNSINE